MLIHRPVYGNLPSYKFYVGTPGETTLVFSEPEWRYYKVMPDGTREPQDGVTTVLHATIDRSGPLMAWAVKEAMIKLKVLMTERGYVGASVLSESALDDIIKKAKTAAKDKLEDAGDVGSQSHDWLEALIKAILKDDDNRRDEILGHFPVDERASNCVAALDWANRHSVKFLHSERKCFSLKHGVAGTCDAICLTSSCDDIGCCPTPFTDSLTLLDFKTANALYPSFLFQTAIYAEAYQEENPTEKIERRFVLRLGKDDGEFESWHAAGDELFRDDRDGFLNALALYRSLHKIETRISDSKEQKWQRQKELLAAERAVRCLDADRYKGVRKKKGCNGSDIMCETCTNKYWEHNGQRDSGH
jgi:hypothetical protein